MYTRLFDRGVSMRRDYHDIEKVQCDLCPRVRVRRVNPMVSTVTCMSCAAIRRNQRAKALLEKLKEFAGAEKVREIMREVGYEG